MSIPSLTSRIEAILYLKGRPISLSELAELARDEPDQVRMAIAMLTTSYAQRDTALEVVEQSGRYCLQLRPCLLYTSPSPRDKRQSRMPSSA